MSKQDILHFYNKIVALTRKYYFYNNFKLLDSFSNRIYLIFFHLSFILIFLKKKGINKDISQNIFDFFFKQIEINLRELGFGDIAVNKTMKQLVKIFYEILFKCQNWNNFNVYKKEELLTKFFTHDNKNRILTYQLTDYFNKFTLLIKDISLNSLLKGVFNFDYKDK